MENLKIENYRIRLIVGKMMIENKSTKRHSCSYCKKEISYIISNPIGCGDCVIKTIQQHRESEITDFYRSVMHPNL